MMTADSPKLFTHILVDIDATAHSHPALDRALRLARRTGATLTVVDVVTVPSYARRYLSSDLEEEIVNRRRRQLEAIAASAAGVRVTTKLLVGRPATVLIQEVLRSKHDLLMRSHARELTEGVRRPFGAIDMELLRKCPCPVLLVQHGGLEERPLVVGAINASTEEPSEAALNTKIVELTLLMAELENGIPGLLQAWAPFAERVVRSHTSEAGFAAYVEDVRQRTAGDLQRLVQSFGSRLHGVKTIHRRGDAADVILDAVVSQGIELVVMGTVARGGIAGLLIGNTAERVLGRLPCSVLAIKPDGFVCPVTLTD